jgi:hypothetical protein
VIQEQKKETLARHLLLLEYREVSRSLLVFRILGRVLSVAIIVAEMYFRYGYADHHTIPAIPFILLMIANSTFWITETDILDKRRQSMSKILAQIAYSDDPELGTSYMRVYEDRYEDWHNTIRRTMMRAEPIIWAALSLVVLLWSF